MTHDLEDCVFGTVPVSPQSIVPLPDSSPTLPAQNVVLDLDETLVSTISDVDYQQLLRNQQNSFDSFFYLSPSSGDGASTSGTANSVPKPDVTVTLFGQTLHIFKRPGLDQFLDYLYCRFKNVAVWTAAGAVYANAVVEAIFKDRPLSFIYTTQHCKYSRVATPKLASIGGINMYAGDANSLQTCLTKPLKKIWRQNKYLKMGFERHNTLFIDDVAIRCLENYGNGVYVQPFRRGNADTVRSGELYLQLLERYLDTLRHAVDVRTVEKRGWEELVLPASAVLFGDGHSFLASYVPESPDLLSQLGANSATLEISDGDDVDILLPIAAGGSTVASLYGSAFDGDFADDGGDVEVTVVYDASPAACIVTSEDTAEDEDQSQPVIHRDDYDSDDDEAVETIGNTTVKITGTYDTPRPVQSTTTTARPLPPTPTEPGSTMKYNIFATLPRTKVEISTPEEYRWLRAHASDFFHVLGIDKEHPALHTLATYVIRYGVVQGRIVFRYEVDEIMRDMDNVRAVYTELARCLPVDLWRQMTAVMGGHVDGGVVEATHKENTDVNVLTEDDTICVVSGEVCDALSSAALSNSSEDIVSADRGGVITGATVLVLADDSDTNVGDGLTHHIDQQTSAGEYDGILTLHHHHTNHVDTTSVMLNGIVDGLHSVAISF